MRQRKQESDKVDIFAWEQERYEGRQIYMFQVHSPSLNLLRKVEALLSGTPAGSGVDRKNRERILLIKKSFSSRADFGVFVANFGFNIEEV